MGSDCSVEVRIDSASGDYSIFYDNNNGYPNLFVKRVLDFGNGTMTTNYAALQDLIDPNSLPYFEFGGSVLFPYEIETANSYFSLVPSKLSSGGSPIPCDMEDEGSGPCYEVPRPWELGLTARSPLFAFANPETPKWTAPYGSVLATTCEPRPNNFGLAFSFAGPGDPTTGTRSYNNVKPPSYHEPAPLPHESTEFSLKLADQSGLGWWNVLKFYPNQYVLDDGEKIIHRGTLVDQAETTETFRLRDGTYTLRMLGFLDSESYDDTWAFGNKDGMIAFGGRYDSLKFTISNGEISSLTPSNGSPASGSTPLGKTTPIAHFEGLLTQQDIATMRENSLNKIAQSPYFKSLSLATSTPEPTTTGTLSESATSHPLESIGVLTAAMLVGMAVMYGVMTLFKSSSYQPVMDVSQTPSTSSSSSKKRSVQIQLEDSKKNNIQDFNL